MERVQQYELWEKNKRREMQYIKTTSSSVDGGGQPQIFYLPKEHNDKTMAKYEASIAIIEEEIKLAKANFEEDLLKIESKLNQNPESLMHADDLHEDDFDDDFDNDETENKPRSVITVAQPHKRPREDSVQRKDQEKTGKSNNNKKTLFYYNFRNVHLKMLKSFLNEKWMEKKSPKERVDNHEFQRCISCCHLEKWSKILKNSDFFSDIFFQFLSS